MFDLWKNRKKNKLRDINIAIEYHDTGKTLREIGNKYNMTAEHVRIIHAWSVKHVLRQLGKYHLGKNNSTPFSKKRHCQETAKHLKEYRDFLLENGIKDE